MKKNVLYYLMLLALLMMPLATYAQSTVVAPYTTGFELDDDMAWIFANNTNGWSMGSATNNGGNRALYISNDGGTSNVYNNSSASASYAYKAFNLTNTEYTISYDWKCKGESNYDYLRVFLAPSTVTLTAGDLNNISTSGAPNGWIALDGGSKLNLKDNWQSVQRTFTPGAVGTYYLVFYWRNDGNGGYQPPAAIDNVRLQTGCGFPLPFTENFNSLTSGIPACWDNSEGTTTNEAYKWNYNTNGYSNSACLRFNSYNNPSGNTNVLATPSIYINKDVRLSFASRNPAGGTLTVKASVDGGSRKLLTTINNTSAYWSTTSIKLDHLTYTGHNVVFYFEAASTGGNDAENSYIYLDNVNVEPLPTCYVTLPYADEMLSSSSDCWRLVRYNPYNLISFTTVSGNSVLYFKSNSGPSGANFTQIAYSPLIENVSDGTISMNITYSTYGNADPLYFGYSTVASEDPDDYTWDGPFFTNGYSDWATYQAEIPNNAVQLAIRYAPTGPNHGAYVDRVELGEVLSCNTPRPIPYTENFEGVTGATYIASGDENQPIPDCWDVSTTYVSANMIYKPHVMSGNLQNSGVNSLALFQYGNTAVYAVLPPMAMPLNQLHLSFWMGTSMSSGHSLDGTLTVGYVTNDSYNSFTAIQSYHVTTSVNTMYAVPLDEAAYNIPSTASRLALKWESSESTFCYIDDITLEDAAGVPCVGKELPYSYGFEYGSDEYADWTVINMSSGVNQAARMSWNNCASYFYFSSQNEVPNGVYDQYLISPELCTPSGVDLEFQYRISAAPNGETFVVGYSTTTSQPSSFIWGNTVTVNKGMAWSTYRQSFPEGTRYIAVHYTSQHRVGLSVDNFAFNNSACPVVENLKAGVANNSVTLKWDASAGNGATYTIYNMSTGAVLASGITNTSYTVNNLAARTSYTFGVKSQCSASTSSTIATVNAVTTCAAETMPFTENFDNLTVWGDLPACWDIHEYNGAIDVCSNASYIWEVYHGHSGLGLTYSSFSNNGYSNTLATPPVTISENAQLVFWYKNPTNGDFTVLASPDGGITRYVLANGLSSQWWTQMTIALNPAIFNGHNVIIYFQATEGGSNDDFDSDICLDEVTIEAGNGVVCTRTIPYTEDFEGYEAVQYLGSTNLDNDPQPVPTCWDVTTNNDVNTDPASQAYNMTFYYQPHVMTSVGGNMCNSRWQSDFKSLCMVSAEHSATYALLPPMDSALNHLKLSFWMGTTVYTNYPHAGTLTVGYVTSDDPGSFVAIQDYPASDYTAAYSSNNPTLSCSGGQICTLDLSSLPSTAWRLAFKWDNPSTWHPNCFIDDIRLTKGFYYQVSVCDEYSWNGVIYNATGLYYANNDTLDLTVIGANTSDITICTTESSYTWYGMTYVSSGEYTHYVYNHETGCDDVEILHLTIGGDCCPPVENLMVTDTGVSSVSLAWDDTHNTGATYRIAYRMEGSYDTVYVDAISSTSYTINGLAYGTTYEFFVSVVCSADASSTLVSVYGTTASCRIESLPYTQDFESGIAHDVNADASTTPFIDCMTRLHALDLARPAIVESTTWPHSGTKCLNWMCYFEDYQIVALPELNTTTYPVNTLSLSFWYRMVATNQAVPTFEIGVMTDPTNASTFVPVTNVTIGDFIVGMWYQANVSLAGYNGTGKFVAIRTTGLAGDQIANVLVDDIMLEERVCLPVTNLTIDNTSTTTVSLSWNGSAPSYTVMNGTAQVATGITDTHYTVMGLTAASNYTFSVIANCSSTESSTESNINVTTDCEVAAVPYNEGFEGYDAVDYFGSVDLDILPQPLPVCWEGTITTDLNNDPSHPNGFGEIFSYKPHVVTGPGLPYSGGTQSLELVAASNSSTYALLPQMARSLNELQMEFWMGTSYFATGAGILTVGYVTDDNTSSFTAIETYPATSATEVSFTTFPGGVNKTINLSSLPVTATRLAFKWENTVDNTTSMIQHPLCFIDDIHIDDIPVCQPVTNLAVDSVSETTVSLSWMGTAANYTVMNGATAVVTGITDTHYMVSGLTAATNYSFSVIANCSATNSSDTVTVLAHTNCNVYSIPYIENFEADGNYDCWTVVANSEFTHRWDMFGWALNGTGCFVFGNSNNPPQYLISPELTGTGSGLQLSFGYRALDNHFSESFMVGYSTTTNAPSDFVWSAEMTDVTNMPYDRYVENMEVTDIKYIAIKYTANNMTALIIDSLAIRDIPECQPVTNLLVDSVSETTVSLSWNGTAASYTVMNDTTLVATGITDTHYTVSGLTAATDYSFTVIANCSSTSNSDSVSVNATTAAASVVMVEITVAANDPTMCLGVIGSGSYQVGDTAILAAVANSGFYFVHWEYNGTVLSTDNPFYLPVTIDLTDTIYAIFDTTNCKPVANLAIVDTTITTVTLSWEDPNNIGATYTVGYFDGTEIVIVATGITTTTYTVDSLMPNTTYYFVVRTDCSDSVYVYSDVVYVTTPTGIETYDVTLKWKLYPNPASTVVTVEAEGMRKVTIFDATGREVERRQVNRDSERFDVGKFDNGVYFFRIEGIDRMTVRKCVISH